MRLRITSSAGTSPWRRETEGGMDTGQLGEAEGMANVEPIGAAKPGAEVAKPGAGLSAVVDAELWRLRCVRGVPLPPPPQPLVPRLLVLSSEESGGSEGDVVEGEESSSGASDPDYRGMSDEAENARAVLAAYRSQNSKRARRGEPSRSRIPRAAPRSSPPGQAPVPRSRHSSASTTADNPAPGFATSAPGFAAPMGSTFAMPSASPSWPVSIPPSVSLLQGDVPAEDVMRSLISARDRESCQGRPDYRAMMEAMVRYGAMGDALEVEAKARQELEAQMGSLNLQCEQLSFQREQMALREKRALEGQRAAEERSAMAVSMAVSRYRESSAFPVDVRAYISEHVEESYEALKATRAGSRYVAMEAAHMADIGEYDMQHKIYTQPQPCMLVSVGGSHVPGQARPGVSVPSLGRARCADEAAAPGLGHG
nr:uncharacterized protein LOC109181117 [Ipomoea trifida]